LANPEKPVSVDDQIRPTFDITEIWQVFNEFFESPTGSDIQKQRTEQQILHLSNIDSPPLVPARSHEMPLTARPPELIARVRDLHRNPFEEQKRSSLQTARVDQIRLPIRTPKQKKRWLRIVQT
jgi:hypothetical protein